VRPHETSGDVTLPQLGLPEHIVSSWEETKTNAVLFSAELVCRRKGIVGNGCSKTNQKFQSRRHRRTSGHIQLEVQAHCWAGGFLGMPRRWKH
jgi:hypothetical protein